MNRFPVTCRFIDLIRSELARRSPLRAAPPQPITTNPPHPPQLLHPHHHFLLAPSLVGDAPAIVDISKSTVLSSITSSCAARLFHFSHLLRPPHSPPPPSPGGSHVNCSLFMKRKKYMDTGSCRIAKEQRPPPHSYPPPC